jgi:hypothetical protein
MVVWLASAGMFNTHLGRLIDVCRGNNASRIIVRWRNRYRLIYGLRLLIPAHGPPFGVPAINHPYKFKTFSVKNISLIIQATLLIKAKRFMIFSRFDFGLQVLSQTSHDSGIDIEAMLVMESCPSGRFR